MALPTSEQVATHEAAHCAVAYLCGVGVARATIVPQRRARGVGCGHITLDGQQSPWETLLISLGGPVGEWLFLYGSRVGELRIDWQRDETSDVRGAVAAAKELSANRAGDRDRILSGSLTLVSKILARPNIQQAVTDIADELLRKLTINGDTINEICQRHQLALSRFLVRPSGRMRKALRPMATN
jgi:hypothetical protein